MATENRGVMVYLPSELEAKITEYCTEHNITRKDKQGNVVISLGSGIVAYLKSQLLSDLPKLVSDRHVNGLTREEVLDLIAESSTSSSPIVGVASLAENRSPDPIDADVFHRLETVEQKLSLSTDIARHEVEKLIQESEQKIMAAVRNISIGLRGEPAEVKTIDERVNTAQIAIATSKEKTSEDTVESIVTDATDRASRQMLIGKELIVWVDLLEKDDKFRGIIQIAVSNNVTNQTIVKRLFKAGYGVNKNTKPYLPSTANEIKNVWEWPFLNCNKENIVKSIDINTADNVMSDDKHISKDIKRWLEPLKGKQFRDIIQSGISDRWSNQEIVTKLFDAGYGKNGNIEPYTANLASAMKTALKTQNYSE
jgi:hypothetical protein